MEILQEVPCITQELTKPGGISGWLLTCARSLPSMESLIIYVHESRNKSIEFNFSPFKPKLLIWCGFFPINLPGISFLGP